MVKDIEMKKSPLKSMVAKSERLADSYSKQLAQSLRAVAKEIIKLLHVKVKSIEPMHKTVDNKRVFVRVNTYDPITLEDIAPIKDTLLKHTRFAQVDVSIEGNGFSVYYYIIEPYAWKGTANV